MATRFQITRRESPSANPSPVTGAEKAGTYSRRYIGEIILARILNDPAAAGVMDPDSAGWELRHIAAEKRSLTIAQKGWAIIAAAVLAWAFAVALAYVLLVGLMLVMPA